MYTRQAAERASPGEVEEVARSAQARAPRGSRRATIRLSAAGEAANEASMEHFFADAEAQSSASADAQRALQPNLVQPPAKRAAPSPYEAAIVSSSLVAEWKRTNPVTYRGK